VKRLLAIAARLLILCAWTLVLGAAALLFVEESGLLRRLVAKRIAAELGPLGAHVQLESAHLRWFEPGLVIQGLAFHGEVASDGSLRDGQERLRLVQVHVRGRPSLDLGSAIAAIEVRGGRALVGDPLLAALAELRANQGPQEELPRSLPRLSVHGFALDLELGGDVVPLGSVDFELAQGTQGLDLRGRFAPTLGGAVSGAAEVRAEGRGLLTPEANLRATVRGLLIDTEGMSGHEARAFGGFEQLRGLVSADLEASMDPLRGVPRLELAAELSAGSAKHSDELPLGDLEAELRASWTPEPGARWRALAGLHGALRASGTLGTSPVIATALLGEEAGTDLLLRAFGSAADVPLGEATLQSLHLDHHDALRVHAALEPRGLADLDFALQVPSPGDAARAPGQRIFAEAALDGRAGMTFRGWPDEHGVPQGFPVPCERVRGKVAFAWDGKLPRPAKLALVDLAGEHASGAAFAEGLLTSPLDGKQPDLDLAIRVPSLAVTPELAQGFAGMRHTAKLWDDLAPSGGELGAEWQLKSRARLGGLTAHGRVELREVGMRWRELPVALPAASGTVELRWAERASRVIDALHPESGEPRVARPIAVLWNVATAATAGLSVRASGGLHGEPLPAEVRRAEVPARPLDWLELELTDVLLRGRDFDILAKSLPKVEKRVQELRAQGKVNASYHGRRPSAQAAYEYDVEVTAGADAVVLTPSFFQRQTQDVAGRVLVQGQEGAAGAPGPTQAQFALIGAWGGDVALASRGRFPAAGPGTLEVRGAGVDPESPTLKGALSTSLSEDPKAGETIDLSALEVDGHLDFEALVELAQDEAAPPKTTYRVFLRENRLRSDRFALEDLHGELVQEGKVLRGAALQASLAGTPIDLRNVIFAPLSAAGSIPDADPRLLDPSFLIPGDGYALQADWSAPGLVLDREHLAPFVDPETLELLIERTGLAGSADVSNARCLAVLHDDGRRKVAFQGRVEPREMRLKAALPVVLHAGTIEVEDLVLEAGRVRGWWRIEDLAAAVAEREIQGASLIMTFVDGRLTLDNLRGTFAGGEVTSLGGLEQADRAIAIDLTPPFAYTIALRLDGVAVEELLGGLFESSVNDLGALSTSFRLRGRGGDVLAMGGGGSVRLSNARLWSIPVVRELFRSLGADATAVFDRMDLSWTLANGTFKLTDIRVRSPLLSLIGEGVLELTGEVQSDLQVRYALVDRLGRLNRVVYWLNNSLWRVALRGDLGRPRVSIRNSLVDLILGSEREHRHSLPLPEWSPPSARF
jgi:hypothetical protein